MNVLKTAVTLGAAEQLAQRAANALVDVADEPTHTAWGRRMVPVPTRDTQVERINAAVVDAHLAARLVADASDARPSTANIDLWANRYLDDLANQGYSTKGEVLKLVGNDFLGEVQAVNRAVVRDEHVDQAASVAQELIDELTKRMGQTQVA